MNAEIISIETLKKILKYDEIKTTIDNFNEDNTKETLNKIIFIINKNRRGGSQYYRI